MRSAFERLASGEAINQPRRRLHLPAKSTLHYMAAGDARYFGAKIYSTNPRHGAHFLFLLYRAEDAAPLALMEANHLGQIRTGAASAYATSMLANPDARTIGIIGSGFQASSQLEAMFAWKEFDRVRAWSRSPERRLKFAREHTERYGGKVHAVDTAEEAVADAAIVITATNSAQPVLEAGWISSGTHINAMGSNQPQRRELPPEIFTRASLIVVDSLEQSRMESGDLLLGLDEQGWRQVAELNDVARGAIGRRRRDDITVFKSNGLAVEDVAAAAYVYERAVEAGRGRQFYS
jgi:ornithine cyclodeaminase/alanine dehydrogenase-like protein (mu-crystallin family)